MSDQDIRSLILFYYLAFLNADRAIEATQQSAQRLGQGFGLSKSTSTQDLVRTMQKIFREHEKRITDYTTTERDLRFPLPGNLEPKRWLEFLKETPNPEILALIWVHILGFDLNDVSQAIQVSEGTMRYRLGRALRSLGEVMS